MIEIQIKTEHFREATSYMSTQSCPLALACKDQLPKGTYIGVGGFTMYINSEDYLIDNVWGGEIEPDTIYQMIQDAKDGNEIETITVKLTPRR